MLLIIFSIVTLSLNACSSSSEDDEEMASGEGTVEVIGSLGQTEVDAANLVKIVQTEGTADSVQVRLYTVEFSTDETCAGGFEAIFSESDTSDCTTLPNTANFTELAESPIFGSSTISAGEYHCMRVIMCDQLVWTTPDIPDCAGTNILDVSGEQDAGAQVAQYYWSTAGETSPSEDRGTVENPFELNNPLTVTADTTNTFTVDFSNGGEEGEWMARYDDEADPDVQCDVPAPTITVVQ